MVKKYYVNQMQLHGHQIQPVMLQRCVIDVSDYQTLEAERDALKELNGALIQTLEDIQSMNDGSIWEQNNTVIYMAQFARQAINKAREVMEDGI